MSSPEFGSNPLQSIRDNAFRIFLAVLTVYLFVDLVQTLLSGSVPVSQFITFLWDGLIIGLVLGLAGIGLTLVYSILGFANFAHGEIPREYLCGRGPVLATLLYD